MSRLISSAPPFTSGYLGIISAQSSSSQAVSVFLIMEQYVTINPEIIHFEASLDKPSYTVVRLDNISTQAVAFKVKMNELRRYSIKPNMGIVKAAEYCEIGISQDAFDEVPRNVNNFPDKILFQILPQSSFPSDLKDSHTALVNMWKTIPRSRIMQRKHKVTVKFTKTFGMGMYVDISPRDVHFQMTPGKESTTSVLLENIHYGPIAFKVKTSDVRRFVVNPNMGIVAAKDSIDIEFKQQAFKEVPFDLNDCRDAFLLQIIPYDPLIDDTETELTDDMALAKMWKTVAREDILQCKLDISMRLRGRSHTVIEALAKYVSVSAPVVHFLVVLGNESHTAFRVQNISDQRVAYKTRTIDFPHYYVVPDAGVLKPEESVELVITQEALEKFNPAWISRKNGFVLEVVPFSALPSELQHDDEGLLKEWERIPRVFVLKTGFDITMKVASRRERICTFLLRKVGLRP